MSAVWRRKGTVLLVALAAVAGALVVSYLQEPQYEATAEVLVERTTPESLLVPAGRPAGEGLRSVDAELRAFSSEPVLAAVRRAVGLVPTVSVSRVGRTDIAAVRAQDRSRRRAADLADAFATAYVQVRRQQTADEVAAAGRELQRRAGELQAQVDSVPAGQEATRQPIAGQLATTRAQLERLRLLQAVGAGQAEVVSPADVPGSPVSPRPGRSSLIALAAGLILGATLAVVLDRSDDSVRTRDDLERVTDLPVLGLVPAVAGWRAREGPRVVSLQSSRSPAAEAYRTLRTAVHFLPLDPERAMIQVTSPAANEGKTTTLANLGVALARAGQQVVLVCCDLRRPRLHEFFGLTHEVGFTSVLLGKVPLSAALQAVAEQDRLYVLASGPIPPNPSELLASRRAVEVLGSLNAEADVVLVDCPPVLPVTDALVLSGRVDATLLVCAAGRTSRGDLVRAVGMLRQAGAPLVGAVLNGAGKESYYAARYDYPVGEPDGPGRDRPGRR